jgi:hypothetical protein
MTPTTRGRFCHVANRAEMGTILLTSCHVYYPRGRLTETLKVQEAGWTEHVDGARLPLADLVLTTAMKRAAKSKGEITHSSVGMIANLVLENNIYLLLLSIM